MAAEIVTITNPPKLLAELGLKWPGAILWKVAVAWANKGRTGTHEVVVVASTAAEALANAWEAEDDRDMRDVRIEWLGPVECVYTPEDDKESDNGTEAKPTANDQR